MRPVTIGTVIAKRVLTLSGGGKVMVELGKPRRFRGGPPDYYCPVRIRGLGDDYISCAAGVDAVQALQLALHCIGSLLYSSEEWKVGKLSWDAAPAKGDLGFPGFDVPEPSCSFCERDSGQVRVIAGKSGAICDSCAAAIDRAFKVGKARKRGSRRPHPPAT